MLVYLQSPFNPCEACESGVHQLENWSVRTGKHSTTGWDCHLLPPHIVMVIPPSHQATQSQMPSSCTCSRKNGGQDSRCPVRTRFLWASVWLLSVQDGVQLTGSPLLLLLGVRNLRTPIPSFSSVFPRIIGWAWVSHSFPFLGYLNIFVYEAWLFVNISLNLCVVGEERKGGETEAEGDRGEKERDFKQWE